MGTVRKMYRFEKFIEIEEYHDGRYGAPGKKREEKKKPTPEQMEKVNQMNRNGIGRKGMRSSGFGISSTVRRGHGMFTWCSTGSRIRTSC